MTTRRVRPDEPARPPRTEGVPPNALVLPVAIRKSRSHRAARAAALLFSIVLLPLMLLVSPDYGATWDEDLQQRRGENIVAYYSGRVHALDVSEDGSHFYGAPFDVLAVMVQKVVPADPYVVRHALNAFVGWLSIVLCGMLAARLFGPPTAVLAMLLLTTTPRYFAHSMNNTKDIPFALLATGVLYGLCRLESRYPFFTWGNALALTLTMGLAVNLRPAGLLFLVFLAVLVTYRLQEQRQLQARPVLASAAWLGGITLGTLIVGSLFWPWALERPLVGPVLGLAQLSRFGWNHSMLFAGQDVYALQPRWDYVPRWLALTLPLVVLTGLLLSLTRARSISRLQAPTIALWAVVVFPIVYIIGVRATVYDEVRHLLFVFPPIAILAASGWMGGLQARPSVRVIVVALLIIGLARPIIFLIRDHPNQVVYFNELTGGPRGAYGEFEMDYWGNCVLQALGRVDALVPARQRQVTVSGWPVNILHMDGTRYPRIHVTDPDARAHQFTIVLSRGSRARVRELAARRDVLARVTTRDGALLCAILPGPAYDTLVGAGQRTGADPANRGTAPMAGRSDAQVRDIGDPRSNAK